MSTIPTSRESDRFMLRLPDGMRDRIKAAAEANSRSMNAEIVARLEASFDLMQGEVDDVGALILRSVLNRMAELAPGMTARDAADAMNAVFPQKPRPEDP